MRLLVTRPAEDAEALCERLMALGHDAVKGSVMEIRPIPGVTLDLTGVAAILVTSRNGARALAKATARRDLPVLAVGASSAGAARSAGFAKVESADGDVEALAALIVQRLKPEAGTLLHVAGSAVAGDLPGSLAAAGFRLRREVLYESRPVGALSESAKAFLEQRTPGGVLFYSPRSVSLFGALAGEAGLTDGLAPLTAYCLSPAIADAARRLPFGRIAVAGRPSQEALLALLKLEPDLDPS